jgi:hypothetical protein
MREGALELILPEVVKGYHHQCICEKERVMLIIVVSKCKSRFESYQ